ncbi:amino acid carrier protein [Salinisphaera sp. PC39]|uniref:alanine/glycine:cation symporter family protein n=1 Tax=Salinisphaera sp. PC39 TaxID=1304156 RepID=UPI00333FC09F
MTDLTAQLYTVVGAINGAVFSVPVLCVLVAAGVLFTVWTGFGQLRALTHGIALTLGRYDTGTGPGAISHFQAVSAALSATVGLGNIAGVALAVEFGGPGAVFWMWVVGLVGMAVKMVEVTLAMLYRNVDDPDNPHGGAMWVARRGLAELRPGLARAGKWVGGIFCLALITNAVTANAIFQSWNVADTTRSYFGVEPVITGAVLAVLVGLVTLGGVRRIGRVAGILVPFMALLYVAAGLVVLAMNAEVVPAMLRLIVTSAFAPTEAGQAFVGASVATAFIWGLKRALFSSEAGLGTAPIAHSAVKTPEPVTEGIVAGLEPFVDTLVVCTITALVILSSGVWDRPPEGELPRDTALTATAEAHWGLPDTPVPDDMRTAWAEDDRLFVLVATGEGRQRLFGDVVHRDGQRVIAWENVVADVRPALVGNGVYADYTGSTLTAHAFDSAAAGLGKWLITLAIWMFALSTMITWSYYGEQGVIYLGGERWVTGYRLMFCALIVVGCAGLIEGARQLDQIGVLGVAFMLCINLPLTLVLAHKAITAYRDYLRRLDSGELHGLRNPGRFR